MHAKALQGAEAASWRRRVVRGMQLFFVECVEAFQHDMLIRAPASACRGLVLMQKSILHPWIPVLNLDVGQGSKAAPA